MKEYEIGRIIHIVKYADRMMHLVEFLIKKEGKAFEAKELSKQFNLTERTIMASAGKVARNMGYIIRYSQSNNYQKTLIWIEKRNRKISIPKGNAKEWFRA